MRWAIEAPQTTRGDDPPLRPRPTAWRTPTTNDDIRLETLTPALPSLGSVGDRPGVLVLLSTVRHWRPIRRTPRCESDSVLWCWCCNMGCTLPTSRDALYAHARTHMRRRQNCNADARGRVPTVRIPGGAPMGLVVARPTGPASCGTRTWQRHRLPRASTLASPC